MQDIFFYLIILGLMQLN